MFISKSRYILLYLIYFAFVTAGRVRVRTASGSGIQYIYMGFWGLIIRTRRKRGSPTYMSSTESRSARLRYSPESSRRPVEGHNSDEGVSRSGQPTGMFHTLFSPGHGGYSTVLGRFKCFQIFFSRRQAAVARRVSCATLTAATHRLTLWAQRVASALTSVEWGAARLFFMFSSIFPVQQTRSGIGYRVKYLVFSAWQPIR